MRIGVDIRSLQDQQPTGVGTYLWHMLRALAPIAGEHRFVLFSQSAGTPPSIPAELESLSERVHVRMPSKLFNTALLLTGGLGVGQRLARVDVMWFPNHHIAMPRVAAPSVMTVHDLAFALMPQMLPLRSRTWHAFVAIERLLQRMSSVITFAAHTKHQLTEHFGLSGDRVSVIPSAAPIIPMATADAVAGESSYIVAFADRSGRKNLSAVLAAYQRLLAQRMDKPLVELKIFGSRPNRLAPQLPGVTFLGYVPDAQKWEVLRSAKALLYPSLAEGFGFPPLEAMQLGVPVITSAATALPEISGSAALLVDPYDTQALARALGALIDDEQLHRDVTQRRRAQVQQRSWSNAARATLDLLTTTAYAHRH